MNYPLRQHRGFGAVLVLCSCCVLLPLQALAETHVIKNASKDVDKTWTGKCFLKGQSGNGQCELKEGGKIPSSAVIGACTVPKDGKITLGGSGGDCGTKKCWFSSCTEGKFTCPSKETSMHVDLGNSNQTTDKTVVYPIWSTDDPTATVAIFQSFIEPIRPQLISNVEFEFVGYDDDGDAILVDKETGVPITDGDGQLFAEFRFEGELYPSGYVHVVDEEMESEPIPPGAQSADPNPN